MSDLTAKPVKVEVKLKISKKTGAKLYTVTVDPISVWIKTQGEEVAWQAKGCDVKVEYKTNGTPFGTIGKPQETFEVAAGTTIGSGAPLTGTSHYNYRLTITPNPPIPQGNHPPMAPIIIDPETVIDDGGPPGTVIRSSNKKAIRKGKKVARRKGR